MCTVDGGYCASERREPLMYVLVCERGVVHWSWKDIVIDLILFRIISIVQQNKITL